MQMNLEGRAIHDAAPGEVVDRAPCIYCGEVVSHINDGGNAWIASAFFGEGGVEHYFYCNKSDHGADVWGCCEIDNVGSHCACCENKRTVEDASCAS